MIRHIYLFKLKDREKAEDAAKKIMTLKEKIPYMLDMEVGIDFREAENSFELCELCTFKSREDFEKFGSDSYHGEIRRYMDGLKEIGIKIDYEI